MGLLICSQDAGSLRKYASFGTHKSAGFDFSNNFTIAIPKITPIVSRTVTAGDSVTVFLAYAFDSGVILTIGNSLQLLQRVISVAVGGSSRALLQPENSAALEQLVDNLVTGTVYVLH